MDLPHQETVLFTIDEWCGCSHGCQSPRDHTDSELVVPDADSSIVLMTMSKNTSNEIDLFLIPEPGKSPEFLAKITVKDPSPVASKLWQTWKEALKEASNRCIIEGYTRDAWAWKPTPLLQTITATSVDGKQKLPGFLGYLKQRQKSAYARIGKILVVISYIQPKPHEKIDVRITLDMTKLPNCSLKPVPKTQKASLPPPPTATAPKRSGGFLGKLVGAQHRTNQHVREATAVATAVVAPSSKNTVLQNFRHTLQEKMLDFDADPHQEDTRIELSLAKLTQGLSDTDKAAINMDVLKYMVYEAAEEVDEEWVVHREPTGFMDEACFVVYKEGCAPPEVLEEINKAELPEEVRGQQRALQEERKRQLAQQESKHKANLESEVHKELLQDEEEEEYLAALNQKKRDRRTIEDYEREKRDGSKKSRLE